MFTDTKYKRWYFLIIDGAKRREYDNTFIVERHHIIPKSLGGDNSKENLVNLTPREHFVCHRLLVKMTRGSSKMRMAFALHTFFHFNKYRKLNFSSRDYETHKKIFVDMCKLRPPTISKDVFEFMHTKTNQKFVGTRNDFIRYSGLSPQEVNWLVNHCISPDNPKKVIKGWGVWIKSLKIFSFDKHRPSCTLNDLPDVTCEHCNKTISVGNYKRWHGSRCKLIDEQGHYERTRQIASIDKH
jgi:hypothetical protein